MAAWQEVSEGHSNVQRSSGMLFQHVRLNLTLCVYAMLCVSDSKSFTPRLQLYAYLLSG